MVAPFPDMGTSLNATGDLTQIFVYCNTITNGVFGPSVLGAFFAIIFFGGLFAQQRFSGRERFEVAFASASFLTTGLAIIMSLENGLLSPYYLTICLALSVASVIWLYFAVETE